MSLVEVNPTSQDCNRMIEWYIHVFGTGKVKPNKYDVILLSKIETMRDALMLEEENFDKLTK